VYGTLSRWHRLATLASLVLVSGSAHAQRGLAPAPPPPEPWTVAPVAPEPAAAAPSEADLERARVLFAEGLDFVAKQDWWNAADRFKQVRAIKSSPVVSYNLASALAEVGQLVESSKLLTQLLGDSQADAETRRAAQLLLSKIEPNIGSLSINVYGNSDGCSFTLDGQPIEIVNGAASQRVDVGPHKVTVERDGETILNPQVTVGGALPLHAQLSLEIPAKQKPQPVARLEPTRARLPPSPRKEPELRLTTPAPAPRDEGEDDESVFEQWWLWAGAGAVVAGGVVAALVLTRSDDPTPVAGDTNPPVIRTMVLGGTR
jgi:hypothetical protein